MTYAQKPTRTWFQDQLDIAAERTRDWPEWARKEAGLPSLEALGATDSPAAAVPCHLCPATAIAVYHLPDGCLARPADREQALCSTHILSAEPHAGMELVRVLHAGAWGELMRFWVGPEESEADGVPGPVWRSATG